MSQPTFDSLGAVIPIPQEMRDLEARERVIARLRERVQRLPADRLRDDLDALLYVCLATEELIRGSEKGAVRKTIVLELLTPFWSNQEALGRSIDWMCRNEMVLRRSFLGKLAALVKHFVELKLSI